MNCARMMTRLSIVTLALALSGCTEETSERSVDTASQSLETSGEREGPEDDGEPTLVTAQWLVAPKLEQRSPESPITLRVTNHSSFDVEIDVRAEVQLAALSAPAPSYNWNEVNGRIQALPLFGQQLLASDKAAIHGLH